VQRENRRNDGDASGDELRLGRHFHFSEDLRADRRLRKEGNTASTTATTASETPTITSKSFTLISTPLPSSTKNARACIHVGQIRERNEKRQILLTGLLTALARPLDKNARRSLYDFRNFPYALRKLGADVFLNRVHIGRLDSATNDYSVGAGAES
jgi:hypothetical protein